VRLEDSIKDDESDTIGRLRNSQVKLGAGRYEHYADSQRRMVNQMRTGTVSWLTLINVLEERSEHVWVCPVFKDGNLSTHRLSLIVNVILV
jgi:hypothetical protein